LLLFQKNFDGRAKRKRLVLQSQRLYQDPYGVLLMTEKEGIFQSVRTKIALVMGGLIALINILGGLIDGFQPVKVDPQVLATVTYALTALAITLIGARTSRNTKVSK